MLPYVDESEVTEEQARLAFFSWQEDGWCWMRLQFPWPHWLVEVKKDKHDYDEQPLIMRPISNNCIEPHYGVNAFVENDYYWRPAVFGCHKNE